MNLEKVSPEDISTFFHDNHSWLSEWLSNIVIINSRYRDDRFNIFQTFKMDIIQNNRKEPVTNILESVNYLKANILMQTVFGISENIGKEQKKYNGFVPLFKRLPEEGDMCLFTATHWFKIEHESFLTGVKGKPILRTTCTVDFLPKYIEEEKDSE